MAPSTDPLSALYAQFDAQTGFSPPPQPEKQEDPLDALYRDFDAALAPLKAQKREQLKLQQQAAQQGLSATGEVVAPEMAPDAGFMEQAGSVGRSMVTGTQTLMGGAGTMARQLGEAVSSTAGPSFFDLPTRAVGTALQAIGQPLEEGQYQYESTMAPEIRRGQEIAQQHPVTGFAQDVAAQIPQLLAAAAVGGGAPALATLSAAAGGQAMQQAEQEGATPEQQLQYGLESGVIEAITERFGKLIGAERLLKGAKLDGVMSKTVLQRLLKDTASNAGEEFAASIGQRLAQIQTYKPDESLTWGDFFSALYSAGIGGVIGLGATGIGEIAGAPTEQAAPQPPPPPKPPAQPEATAPPSPNPIVREGAALVAAARAAGQGGSTLVKDALRRQTAATVAQIDQQRGTGPFRGEAGRRAGAAAVEAKRQNPLITTPTETEVAAYGAGREAAEAPVRPEVQKEAPAPAPGPVVEPQAPPVAQEQAPAPKQEAPKPAPEAPAQPPVQVEQRAPVEETVLAPEAAAPAVASEVSTPKEVIPDEEGRQEGRRQEGLLAEEEEPKAEDTEPESYGPAADALGILPPKTYLERALDALTWKSAKKFFKKHFTSFGSTPNPETEGLSKEEIEKRRRQARTAVEQRRGKLTRAEKEAERVAFGLETHVAEWAKREGLSTQEAEERVNDFMDGKTGGTDLPPMVQRYARTMRTHLDALIQEQLDRPGLIGAEADEAEAALTKWAEKSGKSMDDAMAEFDDFVERVENREEGIETDLPKNLQAIGKAMAVRNLIGGSKGKYQTRTFGIHRQKGSRIFGTAAERWTRKMKRDGTWDRVREDLKKTEDWKDKSDEEIETFMHDLVQRNTIEKNARPVGEGVGTLDVGIYKGRQDLSDPVLRLLGEDRSPAVRYYQTVRNLTRNVATYDMFSSLRELGLRDKWLSEKKSGEKVVEIKGGERSPSTRSPAAGLFSTEDVAEWIHGVNTSFDLGVLTRVTSWMKWAKTVGSLQGQIRNFLSNPLIAFASGNMADGMMPWNRGKDQASTARSFRSLKQGGSDIIKAIEASDPLAGASIAELNTIWRRWADRGVVSSNPNLTDIKEMMRVKDPIEIANPMLRATARAFNLPAKLYQANDDGFKVRIAEGELRKIRYYHPEMSEAEAMDLAADRAKDLAPTESRSPEFLRLIRRFPLMGSFTSFVSEIPRVWKNSLKIGLQEVQEGKRTGNGKMIAVGAHRLATLGLATGATALVTEAALALRGKREDREDEAAVRTFLPDYMTNSSFTVLDRKGNVLYVMDQSFMDPWAQLKDPIRAAIRTGKFDERDFDKRAVDAFLEFMDPYFAEGLGASAVLSLKRNADSNGRQIYSPSAPLSEKIERMSAFAMKSLEPATASSGKKIKASVEGKSVSPPWVEMLATLGPRIKPIDLEAEIRGAGYEYQNVKREASSRLAETLSRRAGIDQEEMDTALESAKHIATEGAKALEAVVKSARALDVDDKTIREMLKEASVPASDIANAMKGVLVTKRVEWIEQNYKERVKERARKGRPIVE